MIGTNSCDRLIQCVVRVTREGNGPNDDDAVALLSSTSGGILRLPSSLLAQVARALKTWTDEILGLEEPKATVVARDRRFLKRLPSIDALSGRQKDALLTTIDGELGRSGLSAVVASSGEGREVIRLLEADGGRW